MDPVEGGVENNYVYPVDPVGEFDLDGKATRPRTTLVWMPMNKKLAQKGVKSLCGSGWTLAVCIIPGLGYVNKASKASALLRSSRPLQAIGNKAYNSNGFGRKSALFGAKKLGAAVSGVFNSSDVLRVGWGLHQGNKVFRIAVGPQGWKSRPHIDILKGRF